MVKKDQSVQSGLEWEVLVLFLLLSWEDLFSCISAFLPERSVTQPLPLLFPFPNQ